VSAYIADFFAPSVGLFVAVDGGVHRGSRSADRRRDEKLRRLGYRVVRGGGGVGVSGSGRGASRYSSGSWLEAFRVRATGRQQAGKGAQTTVALEAARREHH
jgi:hypothetical protein